MARKPAKLFVLDTNVILHDSSCIQQFEENDIVVPIAVLEELDHFKKGNEILNFHAREFLRSLDGISGDSIFNGGVRLGRKRGLLRVELDPPFHKNLTLSFSSQLPDHRILNTAYVLAKRSPTRTVILVTKDVNLRMKAKAVGLTAQDYTTDRVKDIQTLYSGKRVLDPIPEETIDLLYKVPFECPVPLLPKDVEALGPNEYCILRNQRKSALAIHDAQEKSLKRIDKVSAYGIVPRNAEQTFALHALMDPSIQLVSIIGKAGTGKTLLALAAALEKKRFYRQIYLARPVVPLSNKDLGYLPGDIHSKLDPYMQPLFDNLGVIQHQFPDSDQRNRRISELLKEEKLVISPLAYIRGRSLVNIYFIVDEAQNLTPHEVKTIITRAGEGTKFIFTGDIFQIDHPYLDAQSNGLSFLIDKMRGQPLYAHITLEKGERSALAELASDLL